MRHPFTDMSVIVTLIIGGVLILLTSKLSPIPKKSIFIFATTLAWGALIFGFFQSTHKGFLPHPHLFIVENWTHILGWVFGIWFSLVSLRSGNKIVKLSGKVSLCLNCICVLSILLNFLDIFLGA